MQVTIKFNSHTSKGESCGEIEIRDNDNVFQEQKSFTQKTWEAFRVGAGRGAKASQKDYQAFVKFIDDQGHQQYKDTFTTAKAWRAMIERCYY